jgi:hypothetical protein
VVKFRDAVSTLDLGMLASIAAATLTGAVGRRVSVE